LVRLAPEPPLLDWEGRSDRGSGSWFKDARMEAIKVLGSAILESSNEAQQQVAGLAWPRIGQEARQ
jgi:hypothetical protein